MRRVLTILFAVPVLAIVVPMAAQAQSYPGDRQGQQQPGQRQPQPGQRQPGETGADDQGNRSRAPRIAPLRQRPNAGPCPYVKILYDAARYVELADNRAATANVGFTGEIEGVTAGCSYRGEEPITVQMDLLFSLGRGPRATEDRRTYRYWIAVTERNSAVLAKEYFDLPVDFNGAAETSVTQGQTVVIPRAGIEVSGGNFEVLVGFEVTPEMAEFNRTGSRFRVNAGQPAQPAAQ